MATLANPVPRRGPADPPRSAGYVLMTDISWDLYDRLRQETRQQKVRMTFDEGRLVLMSPLPVHEFVKKVLARLVEMTAVEMDVPCLALGSTTWGREDLQKGLEPDECYYVQNEPAVRGRTAIDLSVDPPPDLAIEVDITHQPIDRQAIYAALGVKELWQFDGTEVRFLIRNKAGRYAPAESSAAFPVLTPDVINDLLQRAMSASQTSVMREFQAWLKLKRG